MKNILGILILILVMSSVFADIQISNYEVLPATTRPGVKGTASLTITNSGLNSLKRVGISVQPSTGIEAKSSIYIGDMESGGSSMISVPFTIKDTTPSGVYSLRITVRGTEEITGAADVSLSRAIDIPIYVNRAPSITISNTESSFIIGERFTKNITIIKEGDSASSVRIYSSDSNFILDNSPIYIGDINENSIQVQISGYISSTMNTGVQSINLTVNYFDILGNEYTQAVIPSFEFEEPVHVLNLELDPLDFKSGETKEVKILVKNTGTKRLNEVELSLEETAIFVPLSGERIYLGDLEPGQESIATTLLAIKNIDPGYYMTTFDLKYTSTSGERKTDPIKKSLNIQPNIEVIIFVESEPSPIVENTQHVLSLKVSNIGDSEIKSVWVELEDTEHIRILNAQNKQFIGSLDSDDFSSVQYDVFVSNINEDQKIEELPIKVYFKDSFNNNQIKEEKISVKIYSTNATKIFQKSNEGDIILPLVVLVILGGVGYWYWKKRKKNASR